ncbi:MAG: sulfide/dihydroorotate dehydrogenase-like FAD/NAD-binding protein [Nitrososphaerota archaeon]|jgi:ferredoxin--NADP+ reductase|uniref:sulfide/dihydroorotate dehydrogenase-like FAD/NAD-binding protein n=1 Tax=Candidatus Bathycorpusculum sp. TaxID=2994959 RepID=UPI00282BB509|nr:sulfide/dihydroorotate dehydrogenase-like FAD/NAD-binding protein [Candidatus Termitimicrobium sp.]MCL2432325.1 sulfide/dihydroorotate dehydrogenase-like FAD/NAD-binding protein [Candidatus Termitimicrobium sp.]MDR0493192.1 sulfide/dihydroorotate dehydrogenase-like FAD/NAD-binding protein [Nitrososphaerota archaeon]
MPEDKLQINQITAKEQINSVTKKITVYAPDIAAKARSGQFVIFRTHEDSERIPLTLASWDREKGTITHIVQEIGFSTVELGCLEVGQKIQNVVGPLGNPTEIKNFGTAAIVCGGLGTAVAYPIAKALKETGNKVISIIGARSKNLFILEDEMRALSDEIYFSSDDGTKGQKGFVSDVLKSLIEKGYNFNIVFAIGPPIMMSVVADITRPYGIKTIASLNPIMVDGMGMCGACRVTIDGKTEFACVDGPEFDAHKVDFKELIQRLKSYCSEEKYLSSLHSTGGHCQCQRHQ